MQMYQLEKMQAVIFHNKAYIIEAALDHTCRPSVVGDWASFSYLLFLAADRSNDILPLGLRERG